MKTWCWADGELQGGVCVAPEDRAFRYGMSFFETVAVFSGRAIFLVEHLRRLHGAVASVDGHVAGDGLERAVAELAAGLENGVLRIYATAGSGAIGDRFSGGVYLLFEEAETGGGLGATRAMVWGAPYVSRPGGWKTGNYWTNVDALMAAKGQGCDEAILCNVAGEVVSASMGNLFLCLDGRWVTPPLGSGARDGVVREWVMGRFGIKESVLDVGEAGRCSAGFVTNSRVGIRVIGELDGRALRTEDEWTAIYREEVLRG